VSLACIWRCRHRDQPTSLNEGRGREKARVHGVRAWAVMVGGRKGAVMAETAQPSHWSQQSEFKFYERHTQKSMCDISLLSPCVVIFISVCGSFFVHTRIMSSRRKWVHPVKNRKKFKPFGLTPPPLPRVTEQRPGSPLMLVLQIRVLCLRYSPFSEPYICSVQITVIRSSWNS
jgi:hypothetical protein